MSSRTRHGPPPRRTDAASALRSASSERARPLSTEVRSPLQSRFGHDFGRVRVHDGPDSDRAARALGANALTVGRDIYLGQAAESMPRRDAARLLKHEAVHALQQGESEVTRFDGLPVSAPTDAAERQAHAAAHQTYLGSVVWRLAAPRIQRDLTDKLPVAEGEFRMNMKTEGHPADKNGMSGTITFHPGATAPDATSIRLFQALNLMDLTGAPQKWPGGEADREKFRTTADPSRNVAAGWGIDVKVSTATPRTAAADPDVSPYYRDYWPNTSSSQDGSKSGATVSDASLWDYPFLRGLDGKFAFETVAKDATGGHVYGSVAWGFTIADHTKGTVNGEYASARSVMTRNTEAALEKFNEYYRNKGASTAPK
jgi:hypothetical protein